MTGVKSSGEIRSYVDKTKIFLRVFTFGLTVGLTYLSYNFFVFMGDGEKIFRVPAEPIRTRDENASKFEVVQTQGFSAHIWMSPDRFITKTATGPKTAILRLHKLDGEVLDQVDFDFTITCFASWEGEQIFSPRLEDKSYSIKLAGSQRDRIQISPSKGKCRRLPIGVEKNGFSEYVIEGMKVRIFAEFYEFEQADGAKIRFRKTPFQKTQSPNNIHIHSNETRTLITPVLNYTSNIARREIKSIGFQYFEIRYGRVSAESVVFQPDEVDEDLFFFTGLRAKPVSDEGVVLMNGESIWFYQRGDLKKMINEPSRPDLLKLLRRKSGCNFSYAPSSAAGRPRGQLKIIDFCEVFESQSQDKAID